MTGAACSRGRAFVTKTSEVIGGFPGGATYPLFRLTFPGHDGRQTSNAAVPHEHSQT